MATAVEILCVIAYRGHRGTTAEIISKSLNTNPVVVRRMLKNMEHEGLVEIRPGKEGGVQLALEPKKITLERIYKAVEENPAIFALRPRGNATCPVDSRMKDLLDPVFRATGDDLIKDEHGKSWVSFEDYAIALVDELEKPAHERSRFTIGY